MKRLLIICAVVAVGLVSCAAPITKDDVLAYTGSIMNAVTLQSEAVAAYKSGFNENYFDDETSLGILNNEAVPKFQELAKELKTLADGLKFQELKEMHAFWVNSTEDTLLALNDMKGALEKKDLVLLKTSTDKIDSAQAKMTEYNTRFMAICKKYEIPVAE